MYSKETKTKVCPGCETPKNIETEFYKRRGGAPGSHCKLCTKAKLKKWATDNPERYKEMCRRQWRSRAALDSGNRYHQRLRLECIHKLGGKCAWPSGCDWTDIRVLHIDHKYGGGNKDRKSVGRNQTAFYRKVLADTTDAYQLLCANHNWIKRLENKEDQWATKQSPTTDSIE